jgi:hypothetical protein
MKTIILLASVISLSLVSLACKSKKNAGSSNTSTTTTSSSSSENTETGNASSEQSYRIIVSFTSKGAGVAAEKREAFLKYVDSHPKKPAYKTVLWGREGETDYCLTLSELSKKEQITFIEEVKKAMAGSDQVIITENAVSQHRGR